MDLDPSKLVLERAVVESSEQSKHSWRTRIGLAAGAVLLAVTGSSQASPDLIANINTNATPVNNAESPKSIDSVKERAAKKPNVIFILADDMSSNELQYMPHTRHLLFNKGATADNFFDSVSLCCSSRASIFTGDYVQNTGIYSNEWPGGFYGYNKADLAQRSFPNILKNNGYFTSLMGKYLNGYVTDPAYTGKPLPSTYIPDGWSDWAVPTQGEFYGQNYHININGTMHHLHSTHDFLSDYTNRRATRLIRQNTDDQGLFIEMSDFGPHAPEPASPHETENPRLVARADSLHYPRNGSFNESDVSDKPNYVRHSPLLSSVEKQEIDTTWQRRYLSVKTLDRHVGELVKAVKQSGQLDNTYFIFTSDNGFHYGEHRQPLGKDEEYDTDIKVPFAIRGPGITAGSHIKQVIGNIDIAPTLLDIAGVTPPATIDGRSILPLAVGKKIPWRKYYLIQKGFVTAYNSPNGLDEPGTSEEYHSEALVTRFIGVADERWRYFVFNNGTKSIPQTVLGFPYKPGQREFYDIQTDPLELNNLLSEPKDRWSQVDRQAFRKMAKATLSLIDCKGAIECNPTD